MSHAELVKRRHRRTKSTERMISIIIEVRVGLSLHCIVCLEGLLINNFPSYSSLENYSTRRRSSEYCVFGSIFFMLLFFVWRLLMKMMTTGGCSWSLLRNCFFFFSRLCVDHLLPLIPETILWFVLFLLFFFRIDIGISIFKQVVQTEEKKKDFYINECHWRLTSVCMCSLF